VKSAFAAHETAAGSIAGLADKVSMSVARLVDRIEAIHVPPSLLEEKMDALLAKLSETAKAFENVAEADKGRHKDLAAASSELRRVVTQIANQLSKLQATAQTLQAAANPATTMAESLARAREALDATTGAAKALGDATLAARGASRELTESIKAYGEMVIGVTNAQKAAAATSASDVDAARRRMVQDLEESRAAVAEVQKALADTARVVAEALNAPTPAGVPLS
jgi:chromosome segregation ATPase